MLLNVDRARRIMEREGLDGMVASTLENFFYLTGVWEMSLEMFPHDSQAYVVASRERPDAGVVVTSIGDADMMLQAYPSISDFFTFGTFFRVLPDGVELLEDEQRLKERTLDRPAKADALEALVAALESAGLTRGVVGVDERGANPALLADLAAKLPYARFKPAAALFREIRAVKTTEEQERLIGALRATETAFRATLAATHEGVTERELFHVFEQSITASDARPGFTLIRFGRGMALGQVPSGDTKLEKGDYLWFDVGCTYHGYRSDIGRIVSFGEPGEKLKMLCDASRDGQTVAIEMMKPGIIAKDIFNAGMERVKERGIPHYQRHHIGHGIGIEYYDLPVITPTSTTPLEAGMVFEIETPYYEFGFGGAFIEDTVLVTEQGGKILTELQRELQVIGG